MSKSKWEDGKRSGKVIGSKLTINKIKLHIHKNISCSPDIWFFSCENLHIAGQRLESKDLEVAKTQAIALVQVNLEKVLKELYEESEVES